MPNAELAQVISALNSGLPSELRVTHVRRVRSRIVEVVSSSESQTAAFVLRQTGRGAACAIAGCEASLFPLLEDTENQGGELRKALAGQTELVGRLLTSGSPPRAPQNVDGLEASSGLPAGHGPARLLDCVARGEFTRFAEVAAALLSECGGALRERELVFRAAISVADFETAAIAGAPLEHASVGHDLDVLRLKLAKCALAMGDSDSAWRLLDTIGSSSPLVREIEDLRRGQITGPQFERALRRAHLRAASPDASVQTRLAVGDAEVVSRSERAPALLKAWAWHTLGERRRTIRCLFRARAERGSPRFQAILGATMIAAGLRTSGIALIEQALTRHPEWLGLRLELATGLARIRHLDAAWGQLIRVTDALPGVAHHFGLPDTQPNDAELVRYLDRLLQMSFFDRCSDDYVYRTGDEIRCFPTRPEIEELSAWYTQGRPRRD